MTFDNEFFFNVFIIDYHFNLIYNPEMIVKKLIFGSEKVNIWNVIKNILLMIS